MYLIYQLTEDGEEQTLGYFPTLEEADAIMEELWHWRPHAVIDIRECE